MQRGVFCKWKEVDKSVVQILFDLISQNDSACSQCIGKPYLSFFYFTVDPLTVSSYGTVLEK